MTAESLIMVVISGALRIFHGGNGNHNVLFPIILTKVKVDQMLPSSYKSSLFFPIFMIWNLISYFHEYTALLFGSNGHSLYKVIKRAKIRNRYNQAPHLTQNTNGKVTTSQLDIINESQEVNPFPAGDHKASTNRRA